MSEDTDIPTIVVTLRFLSSGWVESRSDQEWLAEVADEIEAGDLSLGTCPLCQEVECDGHCPLEPHRRHVVGR